MKGILPVSFRLLGYALLILSIFVPMLMYLSGMVHDGTLVYVKLGMKLVVWLSLFMIFLAKSKEEDEEIAGLRAKSMKWALYIWGIYYIGALVKAGMDDSLQEADNSVGIVYMVLNVLCLEFLMQKRRAEKMFKRK